MADNYLERQREQYEARKAAWEKAKKFGKKKPKTTPKPSAKSAGETLPTNPAGGSNG